MPVVSQLTVKVANERGALAEVCTKLAEKAVNILGLMVPPELGRAPVRLVVNEVDVARKIFDGLGLSYVEEEVLAVRLSDRPGALGKVTRKLAARKIDVRYAYGTILKGAGEAVVILAVSDVAQGAKLLK